MRNLLAVPALLALVFLGCAQPVETEKAGSTTESIRASAVSDANEEFTALVGEVESLEEQCESDGKCLASASEDTGLRIASVSLGEQAAEKKRITDFKLCDALRPLAGLESPYFFVGAMAKAASIVTLKNGGVDLVFDLRNQQAAMFTYQQEGLSNLVGLSVTAYTGYGFGKKANVLEAWSGEFQAAEASVSVPLVNVSVGGEIFRSPDNSIWGGLVQASFGFNLIPTPVEVAATEGTWTAWDGATSALGKSWYFVSFSEKNAGGHRYIQFNGTKDIALALIETLGTTGAVPAAQTAALAVLRKQGLTIEDACPSE